MLGQTLAGRYTIIKPLGAGGMGQTFLAKDTHRPGYPICVVKQLRLPNTEFLSSAQRLFNKEAEALEQLGHHPQIPTLLAYFEQAQQFYLVQEFIDGHPLSHELRLGQHWPEAQVIQLLEEVLSLLVFIHEQGVIHRDIKPDNIIRRRSERKLVLIDFGAVKQVRSQQTLMATSTGQSVAVGTPGYMPSEQVMGQPRPSSDLYALGKIGIQALTGRMPTQLEEDEDGNVQWQQHAQVSDGLELFLSQMVRHYFKHRFQTAAEARHALERVQQGEPFKTSISGGSPTQYQNTKISTRVAAQPTAVSLVDSDLESRSQLPWIIGAGVIAGGLVAGAIVWQFSRTPQPPLTTPASPSSVPTTTTPFQDPGVTLLARAKAEAARTGNLGVALETVREIAPGSVAYAESQTLVQQWQADWQQQNALYQKAKTALEAGQWQTANTAARSLPTNAYWSPLARPIYTQAETQLAKPTQTPTPTPSIEPTQPTPAPSVEPTQLPSVEPTPTPSVEPTQPPPSVEPTPAPSVEPTPPPEAGATFPTGTFKDNQWQVVLGETNGTYYYQGTNLRTGNFISLAGADTVTNDRRWVYTWSNGGMLYRVAWRPAVPHLIRLVVINRQGKRLLNRLLRQSS